MRWFAVGGEPVGVVAIGLAPTGVLAIGQFATGVIAIGQLSRGVIVVGQLAVGVFALGQLAVGAAWAGGMLGLGGTYGLSMLGWGAAGYWLPWRPGTLDVKPARSPFTLLVRGLVFVAILALVIYVAVEPVTDAVFNEGGIFRERVPR